ncbi:MAG: ACT domain-containing protein [Candidatus Micrarchaeota archaeon]
MGVRETENPEKVSCSRRNIFNTTRKILIGETIAARNIEVARLGRDGSVRIPKTVLESVGASEGSYFVITENPQYGEIVLHAINEPDKMLYEIKVEMRDVPGSLGAFCNILGSANANIESVTQMPSGKNASVIFVVDMGKAKLPREKLLEKLSAARSVLKVEMRPLSP